MDFTLLLDSPHEPKRTIQIAKLGDDFEHSKYGQFAITPDDIASWKANLDNLPGQRALIDEDHSADRTPRRTEASGWITDVRLENGTPVADIDWTPKGEQAIRDGRYLFISPTFGNFTDERGQVHENTLIGAALTNRPFLNMPSLCLASPERVSEAIDDDPALRFHARALDGDYGEATRALVQLDVSQADRDKAHAAGHSLPDKSYPINNAKQLHAAAVLAASGHGNVAAARKLIRRRAKDLGVDIGTLPGFASDSRALNMPSEDLIKLLALDGDADDQKILEAVTGLKASADDAAKLAKRLEKKPIKTLEQQASDAGLMLLDTAAVGELQRKATAGETALRQLHDQAFDHAFTGALAARKVTPTERDSLKRFYELDADATLKLLEDRQPILPEKPAGAPSIDYTREDGQVDPEQAMRAGIHPGSVELDQKIRAHIREQKLPNTGENYVKVLDQWTTGALVL